MEPATGARVIDLVTSSAVGAVVAILMLFVRERISGGYWEARERWQLKAATYRRLLKMLQELVLLDRHLTAIVKQQAGINPPAKCQALLPSARMKPLADRFVDVQLKAASMDPEHDENFGKALVAARIELVAASRKDLRFRREGWLGRRFLMPWQPGTRTRH